MRDGHCVDRDAACCGGDLLRHTVNALLPLLFRELISRGHDYLGEETVREALSSFTFVNITNREKLNFTLARTQSDCPICLQWYHLWDEVARSGKNAQRSGWYGGVVRSCCRHSFTRRRVYSRVLAGSKLIQEQPQSDLIDTESFINLTISYF